MSAASYNSASRTQSAPAAGYCRPQPSLLISLLTLAPHWRPATPQSSNAALIRRAAAPGGSAWRALHPRPALPKPRAQSQPLPGQLPASHIIYCHRCAAAAPSGARFNWAALSPAFKKQTPESHPRRSRKQESHGGHCHRDMTVFQTSARQNRSSWLLSSAGG